MTTKEELNRKLLKLLEKGQAKLKLEEGTLGSDRSNLEVQIPPQLENEEILLLHKKQYKKKKRQSADRKAFLVFEFKLSGKV